MQQFEMIVNLDRNVAETYQITVEANDPEEAQDIAYNFFVDFPDGTIPVKTMVRTRQATTSSEIVDLTFMREDDVADKVFNDDGTDEPA